MGPDPQYTSNSYPYPFGEKYYFDALPINRVFTESFMIESLSHVDSDLNVIKSRDV